LKYRLIVRASPSAEVKLQIAQKYSSRCGCGSSYHQASECPWGPEGWKDKYMQQSQAQTQLNQSQQFPMLTPVQTGGAVHSAVVSQQHQQPVQAFGIKKKIQSHVFVGGGGGVVGIGGGVVGIGGGVVGIGGSGMICQPTGHVFVQVPPQPPVIYCRARGCTSCTRPGQKHRCNKCGDTNSDHRERDCRVVVAPVGKSPVVIGGVLYWV